MPTDIFTDDFLVAVQLLIERHHTIYPCLPPQGLFFEALVEQAFRLAGRQKRELIPTAPNSPQYDLLVAAVRLSIKSETGKITRPDKISLTKLCTTETGDWTPAALVAHAIAHLGRYDRMLLLRAVWAEDAFDYQLLDVPLGLLGKMREARFEEVGKRKGRRSVAADVMDGDAKLFRVHFDGADGKCQIHQLLVRLCRMLRAWRQPFE
jgi:hypothetical protein